MSRGYLYKLLDNPLYIGRVAHKGKIYEGQHPAIVDPETWEAVQAKLAANASDRRSRKRGKQRSPLAGRLFDEAGMPLPPSHTVKSGRRCRYYVSPRLISGLADRTEDKCASAWRFPAREIERVVSDATTSLLVPEIIEAVLAGTQPVDFTAGRLVNHTDPPLSWTERKVLLGFV